MLEKLHFAPRQTLFEEGTPARLGYLLTRGAALLTRRRDDEHVRVASFGEGELIGAAALLAPDATHSATATALSELEAIAIPADLLDGGLAGVDPLLALLLERVLHRLSVDYDGSLGTALLDEPRSAATAAVAAQRDVHEARLRTELHAALGRGEMAIVYQPVLAATDGRVAGFEALLRWNHPQHGVLPAAEFIGAAGHSLVIYELGLRVFEQVCRALPRLLAPGTPASHVSINLSAGQLLSESHCADVLAIIAHTGVNPRQLVLELREPLLMAHGDLAGAALRRFAEAGLGLAVDNFGAGPGSLTALARLPLRQVKIDGACARALAHDDGARRVLRASAAAAAALGVECVAEGVESAAQVATLAALGCSHVQGFGIARGLPLEAAEGFGRDP